MTDLTFLIQQTPQAGQARLFKCDGYKSGTVGENHNGHRLLGGR